MSDPHDLLSRYHGMLARATEAVWHREPAEAERTLAQADALLDALRPLVDDALYERLLNAWINTAQLLAHADDYGPDQERPR